MSHQIGYRGLFVFCIVACLSAAAMTPATAADRRGSQLFEGMQATGKPAMVIAGNEGCVYCRQIAAELDSNPQLAPFVAQMFVVKIDIGDPSWQAIKQEFQYDGSGIPAVLFVRADGTLIYGEPGKPADMQKFLAGLFEKAGKLLPPEQLKLMSRDGRKLKTAVLRKDWATVGELATQHGGTGSYAEWPLAFTQAGEQLVQQATESVAVAAEQLADEATRPQGAIALVEASIDYETYQPASEIVVAAIEQARQGESEALLAEALSLSKGVQAERTKNRGAAREVYAAFLQEHADSQLAPLVSAKLKSLGG
ncbi:MAG: thioredoxin family protein [Planctomycetaceae bacterium]